MKTNSKGEPYDLRITKRSKKQKDKDRKELIKILNQRRASMTMEEKITLEEESRRLQKELREKQL